MAKTYSTYDAKARFSEIIRQVRRGQRVIVTYRGEEVAEIRPVQRGDEGLARRIRELEEAGIIEPPAAVPAGPLAPLASRPGALARFLDSRD